MMRYVRGEKICQEQGSYKSSEAWFCFVSIIKLLIMQLVMYREICMSLLALQSSFFPAWCGFYELLRFIFPFSLKVLAKSNP